MATIPQNSGQIDLPIKGLPADAWPSVPLSVVNEALAHLRAGAELVRGSVNADPGGHRPLAAATGGTWRVSGMAVLDTETPFPWSMVVKRIVRTNSHDRSALWPATRNVEHPMYWRRELEFYSSDLPNQMGDAISTPKLLASRKLTSTCVELWLEDLSNLDPGESWALEEYATAAQRLGEFQGRYLRDDNPIPLPTDRWLSRGWLRWYVNRRRLPPPSTMNTPSNPLLQALLGVEDVREDFARMWHDRNWMLDILDSVPRTVVHRDFWPPNLFRSGDEIQVLDWAYVGIGSVFEDASSIVPDSLLDGYVSPEHAGEFDRLIFDGHVAGLRSAGVTIDRKFLRLAFAAAAAVKYQWMLRYMFDLAVGRIQSPVARTPAELDSLFTHRAMVLPRIAAYYREAVGLAEELGIARREGV